MSFDPILQEFTMSHDPNNPTVIHIDHDLVLRARSQIKTEVGKVIVSELNMSATYSIGERTQELRLVYETTQEPVILTLVSKKHIFALYDFMSALVTEISDIEKAKSARIK